MLNQLAEDREPSTISSIFITRSSIFIYKIMYVLFAVGPACSDMSRWLDGGKIRKWLTVYMVPTWEDLLLYKLIYTQL